MLSASARSRLLACLSHEMHRPTHFPWVSGVSLFSCAAGFQGYGVLQERPGDEAGSFGGTAGCLATGMCC